MKYITHNRFKKLAACGEAVNIPYGTEMETAGDFIITRPARPRRCTSPATTTGKGWNAGS